ncbi:P-loop containing nucleoside triphosphate hydrolase protein [Suillus cothurnatus]|nr:P-loop containing nucleoside triphosphate hydrolase protein [Suillus cothurnatus]
MPSSSLQLALIALWVEKPSIPWLNPTWQSLTGIAGVPWDYDSDDNLEARAPNVKEWTVSQAKAVKEFMAHCKETPGTVERHSHRPDDTHAEGRAIWNIWIKEQWFKTWKVNIMIDHMFNQEGCCPYTVLARHAITDPAQLPTLSAAQVDTAVSKKLALAMFGNDAFTSGDFSHLQRKAKDMDDKWNEMTASDAHPTMAILRGYVRRVESYIKILSLFKDDESLLKMDERRTILTTMLAAATRDPGMVGDVKTLPKVLRDALAKLSTETQVRELNAIIQATLDTMSLGGEVQLDFEETIPLKDWRSGVEQYSECSMDDLWEQLGLQQTKQLPFFQTHTDPNGAITPWSEEGQAWLDNPLNEVSVLAPRWHQLVGILKMIDRALLGEPVMLMDGVGLGKTMQAVGVIVCLAHYHDYYKMYGMFPGKFASRTCVKTGGNLPDLPTVIVCPPNLQHQWTIEIERYLRRGTFDVLPYVGKYETRKDWWSKACDRCQQPLRRRVVLATTLAIQHDTSTLFSNGPPEDPGYPKKTPRYEHVHRNTIYGQQFCMLFVDEAHAARKYNKVHLAVRGLLERCMAIVAMTATPVTTKPATGMEGSILRGLLVGTKNTDRPDDHYGPVMKKWMSQMRQWFAPVVILRNHDSVDNAGMKILGLPSCHDHTLRMHLLPWEMSNLRAIAKDYLEDSSIVRIGAASQNGPPKSVKLDVLGHLVSYHLMEDGRPPVEMDKSGHTLVTNPLFEAFKSATDATNPDRIVVYSAFPSSNQAILDILDLHDIVAVELNGKTPMNRRNTVLDAFRTSTRESGPRVLILSGVGIDTLWSEQDDRQLCGRIYRHPQTKPVHIYRAIALRTPDVFLNNISFSKGAMHEAFIGADPDISKTLFILPVYHVFIDV